jgi:hypothetical protein
MKALIFHLSASLLMAIFAFAAIAQEANHSTAYHPFLSDRFHLGIGGFWPDKSLEVSVDGSDPAEEIDFEEDLGYSDSGSTPSFNFRWRYGKKWSLWGQYWGLDSEESVVLEKDIEWEDVTFKEGTYALSGVDYAITRVFLGRSVLREPDHEFGVGAGIHWLELDTFIEGQIIDGSGTTLSREDAESSGPLPNIGGWYMYSWSADWMVDARLDWLSATVDEYSGGLWHAQVGIHYQISRIFGIGFSYSDFLIDLDVDDSDWRGSIESRQHGPRLELTASW